MVSEFLNAEPTGYNIIQEGNEWIAKFHSNGLPHFEMVADTEEEIKKDAQNELVIHLHNRLRNSAKCCDILRHETETLLALGSLNKDAQEAIKDALEALQSAASFAQSDVQKMELELLITI